MEYDPSTESIESFLGAFALGITVGAAMTLLLAPRSGRETRAQIKNVARGLRETMERSPEALRRAGERALSAGRAIYDQARQDITR